MHKEGKADEARDLLLAAGYEDGLDSTAQAEYAQLFPSSPEIVDKLDEYAARLADPDAKVRVAAAKAIAKEALRESSVRAAVWLRNPRTTGLLTDALTDPDPEVHVHATTALAMIALRYFRDRRAIPPILSMLQSPHPLARSWACQAAERLAGAAALEPILPLLEDNNVRVRTSALSAVGGILGSGLPSTDRVRVSNALAQMTDDKDLDIRIMVAGHLGAVGDSNSAEVLTSWCKREKDREVKREIRAALTRLDQAS